jgi:TIR domain-containing protein/carboxypeptidase-like protein
MAWKRYDIFISYSHEDSARIDPLVAALRKRRYRVFYHIKSIVVGEQWQARLSHAITSARVCVLCWSEHAKASEFVAYEYSRAEALSKPVLPWLLDKTSLPSMLELHGVAESDPVAAADRFAARLGWPLSIRGAVIGVALVAALLAMGAGYWRFGRPQPWNFSGQVIDNTTKYPIEGVEVDAEHRCFQAFTNKNGRYMLQLPPPKPKYIDLVFLKAGYEGEIPVNVSTDREFNTDMKKLADK